MTKGKLPAKIKKVALPASEEDIFHQRDLIRLEPYGLSLTPDPNYPFLLLKDKEEIYTLPVRLTPLEAGVALTQSNKSIAPVTPHRFAAALMQSLDIQIQQCVFVEIKNGHQYVRLFFSGHPKMNSLKLRADEAMSLVQHLSVPMFATREFIERSKVINSQFDKLVQKTAGEMRLRNKNQNYIM